MTRWTPATCALTVLDHDHVAYDLPGCQYSGCHHAELTEREMWERLPSNDGAVIRDRKYRPRVVDLEDAHRPIFLRFLVIILLLRVEFSLPEACVTKLLHLFTTLDLLPQDFRDAVPLHFRFLIASLEALGISQPRQYIYDICQQCNHVYRCESRSDATCPDCKFPRFDHRMHPYKRQMIFSLREWVQQMFRSNRFANEIQYHVGA